jgi:hypothetical protein
MVEDLGRFGGKLKPPSSGMILTQATNVQERSSKLD